MEDSHFLEDAKRRKWIKKKSEGWTAQKLEDFCGVLGARQDKPEPPPEPPCEPRALQPDPSPLVPLPGSHTTGTPGGVKYEHDEVKWTVREWLKELDGVHVDPIDLDVMGLANHEAKQKPSPKTARHSEEIEVLTLLVAKIDVKSTEKEERGGTNAKEVKALVEMSSSIFDPFRPNKTMVADLKLREESKNSTLTSRGYPLPAADTEEMQKQISRPGEEWLH